MTPAEKALAAKLLRMASDQFSNHGCNDFDLSKYITDPAERDALVLEACGEVYGEAAEPDYRIGDSVLMDLMAERLEADTDPEGGWCVGCGEAGHTDDDMHVKRVVGRQLVNTWVGHLR